MTHTKLEVTEQQRKNLKQLADFLEKLPSEGKFDMGLFHSERHEATVIHNCNTSACAVGWGPTAGIEPKALEDWESYSDRVFVDIESGDWDWLFDDRWEEVDNTPTGAAERIKYSLKHGVPENWYDQMTGEADLCYKGFKE